MRSLRMLLLVFFSIAMAQAQADCGRLSTNDTYEILNEILECLELRISEVDRNTATQSVGKEEVEDNNHVPTANLIAMEQRVRGKIAAGDRDFFKFRTSSQTKKFRVILRKIPIPGFFAAVRIYDEFEQQVGSDSASYDTPVSLLVEGGQNSFYFISVTGGREDTHEEYELVVREEK